MRTHDKRHARTHLHPRHRKQHLAPSTSTMKPRRWVTRSALTASPSCRRRQSSRPPRRYLGGMLPARMSVNVVDEHHALHARKKVDPLPNSVMRAWIHVLPPGGCCDLNVFSLLRPPPPPQTARPRRWIFARRRDIRQTLRGRNHTLGKSTLVSHRTSSSICFFMADYPLLG